MKKPKQSPEMIRKLKEADDVKGQIICIYNGENVTELQSMMSDDDFHERLIDLYNQAVHGVSNGN